MSGSARSLTSSPKAKRLRWKLLGFDDRGKTRLSMKVVDQETGEDLSKTEEKEEA